LAPKGVASANPRRETKGGETKLPCGNEGLIL
jgi:hypothetical protein